MKKAKLDQVPSMPYLPGPSAKAQRKTGRWRAQGTL
jgi:hypothetical protein